MINDILNTKRMKRFKENIEPDCCRNCKHGRPGYKLPIQFEGYINCAEDPKRWVPIEDKVTTKCNHYIRMK